MNSRTGSGGCLPSHVPPREAPSEKGMTAGFYCVERPFPFRTTRPPPLVDRLSLRLFEPLFSAPQTAGVAIKGL